MEESPKPPIEPTVDGVAPKSTSADKGAEPPRHVQFPPQIEPPPQGHGESCHCRPDQTPWWKVILEVAALFTVICYTIAAYRQADTMNKTYGEIRKQTCAAQKSAKAVSDQATLLRQQMIGTQAAVINPQGPQWTPSGMVFELGNIGHVISPNATLNFRVIRSTFPDMRPLGSPQYYSEKIPQIMVGGWSKPYPIPQPALDISSQKDTLTINGVLNFDNGFGERFEKSFCISYIGRYSAKVGDGVENGGGGFWPCETFKEKVAYILTHPTK